mmetsp:Transcript_11476/g.46473  ORF Transcript_11476/g.46473 Transcript_11476/m.46473 type:complete len:270 (+) Transcript_11476:188-997(+)
MWTQCARMAPSRSSPNASSAAASCGKSGKSDLEKSTSSIVSERCVCTKTPSYLAATSPRPLRSSGVHVGRKRGVMIGATRSPVLSRPRVRSMKASWSARLASRVSASGQRRSIETLPTRQRGAPRASAASTRASHPARCCVAYTTAHVVPWRIISSTKASYQTRARPASANIDSVGNACFARNPSSAMSGRSMPVPANGYCDACTCASTNPGTRNARSGSSTTLCVAVFTMLSSRATSTMRPVASSTTTADAHRSGAPSPCGASTTRPT